MTPDQLLAAADRLLEPGEAEGIWARSSALLIRQALESVIADVLRERAPGAHAARFATQLVVLPEVLDDADLGRRAAWAWQRLTVACHADDMRLPPTAGELKAWGRVARELEAVAGSRVDGRS
jgi:hypothetical protein